ncbi:hypothetical protein BJ878DRAFT_331560 [Calycina marina]|uniref:Uncharacterized protein n=1 Tax=Calycina marina TaxID=1763456 RepID=A0A9P7YVQ7_9HELO|nr:hypothetical protein BJ878DRAFT_331560 [Calycina marina]
MCRMLVDPHRNPVRVQFYEAQIEYHNIPIHKRHLQRKLKEHTKGGRRYKMAFVKKQVSDKNRAERVTYGTEHRGKSIRKYWSCITFTDEAHIDPSSQAVGYILREGGTRYGDENIMKRLPRTGLARYSGSMSLRAISKGNSISKSYGRNWRTRPKSAILGGRRSRNRCVRCSKSSPATPLRYTDRIPQYTCRNTSTTEENEGIH